MFHHLHKNWDLDTFLFQGGLGACVSKADVLATTPEELMYLQGKRRKVVGSPGFFKINRVVILIGERIIVLKHIENDIYMVK